MTLQMSVAARNGMLNAFQTAVGTAPLFQIWTGTKPTDCASASTGTKLIEISLASSFMAAASAGSKSFSNLPLVTTAITGGTASYFRLVDTPGTTCHYQGTVGTSGADFTLNSVTFNSGQAFNVTLWSLNMDALA